jgi:hypothetical protein
MDALIDVLAQPDTETWEMPLIPGGRPFIHAPAATPVSTLLDHRDQRFLNGLPVQKAWKVSAPVRSLGILRLSVPSRAYRGCGRGSHCARSSGRWIVHGG